MAGKPVGASLIDGILREAFVIGDGISVRGGGGKIGEWNVVESAVVRAEDGGGGGKVVEEYRESSDM